MRWTTAAAALLLLPGCLDDASGDPDSAAPDAAADLAGLEVATQPLLERVVLGSLDGLAPGQVSTPSPLSWTSFDVNVPEGGATEVQWELTTGVPSSGAFTRVEGPGCTAPADDEVGTSWQGTCDDLTRSTRFAVHTTAYNAGFTAQVTGLVVAGSMANATA